MRFKRFLIGVLPLLLTGSAGQRVIAAPASCESLTAVRLTNAKVTSATEVAAGAFTTDTPPNAATARTFAKMPSFCRVSVTATPTAQSDIKIEVWLPASGWNGSFQAVGNGGWAGTVPYPAMAVALSQGYATAGTDTGHSTPGAEFSLGQPEKLIDYAHRSLHELAVHGKAVTSARYGQGLASSIFNGCSTGGNQGLTLASKYPNDFEGIIVGAPPDIRSRVQAVRLVLHRYIYRTATSAIPPEKHPVVHQAALQACDANDGVKDGVIDNPPSCKFDPKVLQCQGADGPSCLTAEQVDTARAMYSEIKHPVTGEVLYTPLLQPGSELLWSTLGGPRPFSNALEQYRWLVAKDPKWDPATFNAATDVAKMDKDAAVLDTASDDLRPFFKRGGKILLYHGWADQQNPSSTSLSYFGRVVKTAGQDVVGKNIQLYMIPGMTHCQGGVGTDTFDKVGVIEAWMKSGRSPDQIVASHLTDGKVDRTRPLCPYPQVAVYKGSGSTDDAANFACKAQR